MKNLQNFIQENLQVNEAHDPFFLTGKISQYLCEVRDRDEVKEIISYIAKGLKMGLDKRKKTLSSEVEANGFIEKMYDSMTEMLEKE